ncbi:glycosyltransferase family 61 protein [Halomonas cerina]|uniref:Glycosyltransferase 61 catalytic domain-containing protein n=1 Tax=Halomonas cerina TaxID=447424 RepID=A0A839V497_9GAMM|nr:glycosyltransferase family 61 protein [Halomonas cerina]MBB3188788.1 hypothetical protein [Halomonas cerina]
MAKPVIMFVKKVVNNVIRGAMKKTPVLLEHVWFVSPRRSRFSSWYQDTVTAQDWFVEAASAQEMLAVQPKWKGNKKVTYSGVSVLSKAKLLMCRPPEIHQRHPASRKAIVCTRHYRPLKYPGAQSVLFSLNFMLTHFGIWRNGKKMEHLSATVALLGNRVFDNINYYHFWADVIADVWYIKNNLPRSEWPDYYLVPFAELAWQWEVLWQCGVREEQVIPYAKYDVLFVEKVVIPIRDKGAANLPPWLSRAIHDMSGWSPRSGGNGRLVFVSRADASRRRLVNEDRLRERLRQEGFEVHALTGLSIKEQQHLFSSASIICAPHGASLTNLVWCCPGTVVIDFLSERHLVPCFKELAEQNQVIYYPYVCRAAAEDEGGINDDMVLLDGQIESVVEVVSRHVGTSGHALDIRKG